LTFSNVGNRHLGRLGVQQEPPIPILQVMTRIEDVLRKEYLDSNHPIEEYWKKEGHTLVARLQNISKTTSMAVSTSPEKNAIIGG
jgi:hypothetical protein